MICDTLKTLSNDKNNETMKYIGKITKRNSTTSLNREELSFVKNEATVLFGKSLLDHVCDSLYNQTNKVKEELLSTGNKRLVYRAGTHGVHGTEDFGVREDRKYCETLILRGLDVSKSIENSFERMFLGANELGGTWERIREVYRSECA